MGSYFNISSSLQPTWRKCIIAKPSSSLNFLSPNQLRLKELPHLLLAIASASHCELTHAFKPSNCEIKYILPPLSYFFQVHNSDKT